MEGGWCLDWGGEGVRGGHRGGRRGTRKPWERSKLERAMLCYSGQGRPTVWEPMATEEIACDIHRERGCRAMQGHTGKHQY